jgi:hypothetical protein
LIRRDGLFAWEKREGKTPLGTPTDGVIWLKPEDVEDDDVGLNAARVAELELDDRGSGEVTEV